jgi:ribosomal protein S27E
MINGKQINLSDLPSKGLTYGELNFEIFVRPMTAKEEMATHLERFGVTKASYYDNLLDNIIVNGDFNKKTLLFGDIQYIDLIRRLFTFELDELIYIKDITCESCGKILEISFMHANDGKCKHYVEFEDYKEECFNKTYIFSDGVEVTITPVTMDRFIKISRKYLSNAKNEESSNDYLFGYLAASVVESKGKTFESVDSMQTFFMKYFKDLYKYKDKQLLNKIDKDICVVAKPFQVECEHCSNVMEVDLEPTMRFHQE